jgi:catechol 2,3-dioxygenase-like lactoylglutathione lyase family enzyme
MAWRFPAFLLALAVWPAAAQDKLALDGIAHVALRVADLQTSREFYRKLGFEQAFEFSDAGGTTVSYVKVNDRQFIELYRRTAGTHLLGLMHICFDARDMDGVHAEYLTQGLKPTDVQKARAGNLLFTMMDPEGQLLEFTQYMPGSLHSNARGQYLGDGRISQRLVRAVTAVKDLGAQRAFYTGKLGFAATGNGPAGRFRIAGNSGEEVELASASPGLKPRISLAVANLQRTADDLRARGIDSRTANGMVTITDPDGAILEFVLLPSGAK